MKFTIMRFPGRFPQNLWRENYQKFSQLNLPKIFVQNDEIRFCGGLGDVTQDVVDSIKERCLQWIGRERKLILILTLILTLILNTNPEH